MISGRIPEDCSTDYNDTSGQVTFALSLTKWYFVRLVTWLTCHLDTLKKEMSFRNVTSPRTLGLWIVTNHEIAPKSGISKRQTFFFFISIFEKLVVSYVTLVNLNKIQLSKLTPWLCIPRRNSRRDDYNLLFTKKIRLTG